MKPQDKLHPSEYLALAIMAAPILSAVGLAVWFGWITY